MPLKNSYITFTDQFSGCGGWSLAVKNLAQKLKGGLHVRYAMNHWDVALGTHQSNFQETLHDKADISSTDPRRYKSTDFLLTSPECTKQTNADGSRKPKSQIDLFDHKLPDPAAEKSRATMWDVPRFAEVHHYNYIILENVWQARKWVQFETWLKAMHNLGYKHKIVYFNSMFAYPVPQSRDRMYIHFWKKGNKAPDLNYYPKSHCAKCDKTVSAVQSWKATRSKAGIYGTRGQYLYCCPICGNVVNPYYYAAINAIDLTDIGPKIGERTKSLASGTIKRVKIGREKMKGHPFYIQFEHSKNNQNIRSVFDVFPTQATRQTLGFLFPPSASLSLSDAENKYTQSIYTDDTLNRFISYYYSGSDMATTMVDPINTFTTVQGMAIVKPTESDINDWHYRMIKLSEGKKIMGFPEWYDIQGDSKEQFMQLGNAVTPQAGEWQIERALQTFN